MRGRDEEGRRIPLRLRWRLLLVVLIVLATATAVIGAVTGNDYPIPAPR